MERSKPTNETYTRLIALVCFVLAVCACSENKEAVSQQGNNVISVLYESEAHSKPGADIRFEHNYDGKTELGETEHLELTLSSNAAYGVLSVVLHAQEGLQFVEDKRQWQFNLADHKTVKLPVDLFAQSGGRYYLSLVASIRDAEGVSSVRTFGLALQVHGGEVAASHSSAKVSLTSEGEKIIVMPAEEDF